MKTSWNTGRKYSKYGQRIAALYVEGKGIVFFDLDRGIDGFHPAAPENTYQLMTVAMGAYDTGDYQSAWEYPDAVRECKYLANLL